MLCYKLPIDWTVYIIVGWVCDAMRCYLGVQARHPAEYPGLVTRHDQVNYIIHTYLYLSMREAFVIILYIHEIILTDQSRVGLRICQPLILRT